MYEACDEIFAVMNATSRAILQTVIATDPSLSHIERDAIQGLMDGLVQSRCSVSDTTPDVLLVTQKAAAKFLSVSRVTVWRLTRDSVLHPVEILPGTWRYPYSELLSLARGRLVDTANVTGSETRHDAAA